MTEPAPRDRNPRTAARALRATGLGLLLACGLAEGALHLAPTLLPASFRDAYPAHGVELFQPGALARAPVDGLPLPMAPAPWDGPPPADLEELGIAPAGEDVDARRFPRVTIPADARGLPNPRALERARTVLVGDSFVVSASYRGPGGLIERLESAGAGPVYSLGVSGIGPLREAWLLREVGFALEPRLVLWCWFGGNDLADAKVVLDRRASGLRVQSELAGYRPPPRWRSLALLRWFLTEPPLVEPRHPALPALTLEPGAGAAPEPVWFLPSHLGRLALPRADWEGHLAWDAARATLLAVRRETEERGARFVLLYLPSKAQVLVPRVRDEPELLRAHLSYGLAQPFPAGDARGRLLHNRDAQEALVADLCRAEGIEFLSATPVLEALLEAGTSGFLVTDTHWCHPGVAAVADALVRFLGEREVLPL